MHLANHLERSYLKYVLNLINKFTDKERIRLKLIRSGEVLSKIGINEENYTAAKILFSIVVTLLMKKGETWGYAILYGVMTYIFIEWYLSRKIKKRHAEINGELDTLVSSTIDFLEQGFSESEIFSLLMERVEKNNPLYREIARVNVRIGSKTVNMNISKILDEFQERIGMEEIDNYCLALKQYEVAGKAIRMLRKQLELIRSEGNQKKKRETQVRANGNSIATAIFVICIIIFIMTPMIISALNSPLLKN